MYALIPLILVPIFPAIYSRGWATLTPGLRALRLLAMFLGVGGAAILSLSLAQVT